VIVVHPWRDELDGQQLESIRFDVEPVQPAFAVQKKEAPVP
jgi:hypothetical protein